MSRYKIIVLPDGREFQVLENSKWMSMDESGEWYSCVKYPEYSLYGCWHVEDAPMHKIHGLIGSFEPGNWTTQLYWIGD
jgi:hypothetical protein